jgi:hypothetical protein
MIENFNIVFDYKKFLDPIEIKILINNLYMLSANFPHILNTSTPINYITAIALVRNSQYNNVASEINALLEFYNHDVAIMGRIFSHFKRVKLKGNIFQKIKIIKHLLESIYRQENNENGIDFMLVYYSETDAVRKIDRGGGYGSES